MISENWGKKDKVQYDLVLTDIQMPGTDGFAVIKKLRTADYSHYRKQPVIAMTGRRDLGIKSYTDAGFSEILQKPFGKEALLKVLFKLFPGQFLIKNSENEQKKA